MLKRQQRLLISVIIFIAAVGVFTRVDYLIHHDLYESGLTFQDEWFWTSQILYWLMYQFVILTLFLYSRSRRLLIIFEAFACTGGPDIVGYFLIWNGGVFPATDTIWTWNILYVLFGFPWTVVIQAFLMTLATSTAIIVAVFSNPDKGQR